MTYTTFTYISLIAAIWSAMEISSIAGILVGLNLIFMPLLKKILREHWIEIIYKICSFFIKHSYFCLFILTLFSLLCYTLPFFLSSNISIVFFLLNKSKLFIALYCWLYEVSTSDFFPLFLNTLLLVWIGVILLFICLRLFDIPRYLNVDYVSLFGKIYLCIFILLFFIGLICTGLGILGIYIVLMGSNNNEESNSQNTSNNDGGNNNPNNNDDNNPYNHKNDDNSDQESNKKDKGKSRATQKQEDEWNKEREERLEYEAQMERERENYQKGELRREAEERDHELALQVREEEWNMRREERLEREAQMKRNREYHREREEELIRETEERDYELALRIQQEEYNQNSYENQNSSDNESSSEYENSDEELKKIEEKLKKLDKPDIWKKISSTSESAINRQKSMEFAKAKLETSLNESDQAYYKKKYNIAKDQLNKDEMLKTKLFERLTKILEEEDKKK